MKFGRSDASDIDEFGVTTLIAFELVREPRNGMQWLVGIPDQVKQPHEIVALQIVRAVVVRKSGFEQADLGERIYPAQDPSFRHRARTGCRSSASSHGRCDRMYQYSVRRCRRL